MNTNTDKPPITNFTKFASFPAVEFSHAAKPSWKKWGDGLQRLHIHWDGKGGLSLTMAEWDGATNRTRETMHSLSPEQVAHLKTFLLKGHE